MDETLNIIQKKDNSVDRVLNLTIKDLEYKYKHQRKVNERFLKKKTPLSIAFTIIYDVLCGIMLIISGLFCFSSVNSMLHKVCPTFCGFSNLTIVSGSMVKSGFNIGDTVVVRSVDTSTLKENDIIAFYGYQTDIDRFDKTKATQIEENSETRYIFRPASILGYQTDPIIEAGQNKSGLYFHHIRAIFVDENGTRWFSTYGSSNPVDDRWYISEDMVVGIYDNSPLAVAFSKVLSLLSSKYGIFILLAPVFLIAIVIILECIKDIQLAFLELDCVEEKRKITDDICVRNDVGFNMDEKTKYKILAQAKPEDINAYISLLWRNGTGNNNIRKYYLRKNALYLYDKKMLELNRKCEEMYKAGESTRKIATFYLKEKEKLQEEYRVLAKELKAKANQAQLIGSDNVNVLNKKDKKNVKTEKPTMLKINN